MDSPKSPTGSTRKHGRNISHPIVRRGTKGPLDAVDNPLAEPVTDPSVVSPKDLTSPTTSGAIQEDIQTLPETPSARSSTTNVDFRFLLDPSIYHPLPTDDIHPAFLNSKRQPPKNSTLQDLLQHGHFRRAAAVAVSQTLQCDPGDAERIFELLYTRLACLVLISQPDVAMQEAIPLTDLLARNSPGARNIVPLIPWELRLLLVRLQSFATQDGCRRGIMALYALAAEVRAHVKESQTAGDLSMHRTWGDRLWDIGLRVADALVEMGELETANRHLDTLDDIDHDEIAYRKALLRLRVGDIAGARRSVEKLDSESTRSALDPMFYVVDGDFGKAADTWQHLIEQQPHDPLSWSNLAVAFLYTGRIGEGRQVLEELIIQAPSFSGSLFNLSSIYELCTEHTISQKQELAQRIAAKEPLATSGGWEKSSFEFKL